MMEVSDEILADAVAAANVACDYEFGVRDMHNARAVLQIREKDQDRLSRWGMYIAAYVKAALKYSGKAP